MSEARQPPRRVRITGLQEAQLPDLVALDAACSAMYHEVGFDAAEVPSHAAADIARLTRDHDLFVAEADDVVAGWIAWRDEAPGVAFVAECSVHPDWQRLGIGAQLVRHVLERAQGAGIDVAVLRCWRRAPWAWGFYEALGFREVGPGTPSETIAAWIEDREASGRPYLRPGEAVLWRRTEG